MAGPLSQRTTARNLAPIGLLVRVYGLNQTAITTNGLKFSAEAKSSVDSCCLEN
jgi:hypothetical protein